MSAKSKMYKDSQCAFLVDESDLRFFTGMEKGYLYFEWQLLRQVKIRSDCRNIRLNEGGSFVSGGVNWKDALEAAAEPINAPHMNGPDCSTVAGGFDMRRRILTCCKVPPRIRVENGLSLR